MTFADTVEQGDGPFSRRNDHVVTSTAAGFDGYFGVGANIREFRFPNLKFEHLPQ